MDALLDATKSASVVVSLEEVLEYWMQCLSGLNLISILRKDRKLNQKV